MELTIKEQEALKAIAQNGMDGMGGREPKDLHNDNFSWFNITDMMDFTSFNRFQCAGLISSLMEKGLIGDNQDGPSSLHLTTKGIDVAQDLWVKDLAL